MALFLMLFSTYVTFAAEKVDSNHYMTFSFTLRDTTIKDVFNYIEQHSEYVFLYATEEGLSRTVNVSVKNKSVRKILDEVLEGTGLCYEIDGKQILVKTKPEAGAQSLGQAQKEVEGLVLDAKTGEPVIGATVRIKGGTAGVITDISGEFRIRCAEGDVLVVSFVGYDSREIKISKQRLYTVELSEVATALEEVVVTAFGVGQKKESLVGAVQQVKPQELKVPSSSLSSAFAGRMAGVIAVQRSGEPGADGADFWIRGKSTFSGVTSALIILDGVEISSTELNALDPEVIESFSILKDATATALYGTRGANGVMIVTTKNGKNLDKPIINFRLEGAMSTMLRVPEMVDGPTYMRMFNEAVSRPGCDVSPYSQEKIDGTVAGLNPYIYPDVDWFDELFNRNAFSQRVNFNIRGGSSKMDYFMSASFKHSSGHMKSLSKDYFSYNNNINNYNYDFIGKATRL